MNTRLPLLRRNLLRRPVGARGMLLAVTLLLPAGAGSAFGAVSGWLAWRGPEQNGVSRETGPPERIASREEALWTADWSGQSTPVIANGRLYIMGYRDDGPDLQEGVACFDAETGEWLWQRTFNDY